MFTPLARPIALESLPDRKIQAQQILGPAPASRTWAIVLAGGDGCRLRPLVRRLFGDERPKQYAPLLGPSSLLRQTLDRVGRLVPAERTLVVSQYEHGRYVDRELTDGVTPHVLLQPENRGTGTAIVYAAHVIRRLDPEATVAVFPSDHYIREEDTFLAHVTEVVRFVERHPERLILLGARPTWPEPEYGWVGPGAMIGETSDGRICRAQGFLEKPEPDSAERCMAAGWLWNTFAFVTTLPTLLEAGREFLPDVDDRLNLIGAFSGSRHEGWAVRQAYALLPTADFSRGVLERCPAWLGVSRMPALTWSDLGTPRRVVGVASSLPMRPMWMAGRKTAERLASILQGPVTASKRRS
ncbi:MAG: sugar phosphate nucleotidyltransferase [Candidatus Rokuibacteriota bacterium]